MGAPAAEWERPQSEGTGGKDGAGFEYRYENVVLPFPGSLPFEYSQVGRNQNDHFVILCRYAEFALDPTSMDDSLLWFRSWKSITSSRGGS